MSDGKTHGKITVTLAPVAAAGAFYFSGSITQAAVAMGGCLFGLLVDPDLDIENITASELRVFSLFGLFIGKLWVLFWLPYAKVIEHRDRLSHGFLLGTFGRVAYLYSMAICIVTLLGHLTGYEMLLTERFIYFIYEHRNYALYFLAGLVLSDTGHLVADTL